MPRARHLKSCRFVHPERGFVPVDLVAIQPSIRVYRDRTGAARTDLGEVFALRGRSRSPSVKSVPDF